MMYEKKKKKEKENDLESTSDYWTIDLKEDARAATANKTHVDKDEALDPSNWTKYKHKEISFFLIIC